MSHKHIFQYVAAPHGTFIRGDNGGYIVFVCHCGSWKRVRSKFLKKMSIKHPLEMNDVFQEA